ncbi:DUF552 domain-containing protein [Fusobacterium necrophorum]|uniref:DUF552 domain-containing protein n=1 Tax=Fusobacterium necrophorum TaxID=859 RepID=A0A4Q2KUG2_9FUSO|nr:cell division protein SepF [Fusobacterium necrophorum]RXZ69175.1 DUF552 domain-containing protein [Fusobacterium necrophorum]
MKENEGKKKGLFSTMNGFTSGMKELFGIDSVEGDYEEEDTGIIDFSTADEPIVEENLKVAKPLKPSKQKTFFGKAKSSQVMKEVFSNEDDGGINNCQTVFVDPKGFGDAERIADYILKDKMITINLEFLDTKVAQRLMDFLAGAMRVKEASFVAISKKVYTIVPKSMKVHYEGKKNQKKTILEFEREE